ncbi:MAG: hypothetical protein BWY09_00227 [Candidatus Hydrogenedentes bacterium ADurb.Bin179]|nr:MAG: hypothetical protein BWY09_00227 [Candidatus Hydrogenedentes bacterium ADurb.Bin179]
MKKIPDHDQLLSLAEATHVIPTAGGRPPAVMTLYRWTRGVRGVTLPSLRFGRRICVRYGDLIRFAEELAQTYEKPSVATVSTPRKQKACRSTAQRAKAIEAAEAHLQAAGFMTAPEDPTHE